MTLYFLEGSVRQYYFQKINANTESIVDKPLGLHHVAVTIYGRVRSLPGDTNVEDATRMVAVLNVLAVSVFRLPRKTG